jgi:hypothetical protein
MFSIDLSTVDFVGVFVYASIILIIPILIIAYFKKSFRGGKTVISILLILVFTGTSTYFLNEAYGNTIENQIKRIKDETLKIQAEVSDNLSLLDTDLSIVATREDYILFRKYYTNYKVSKDFNIRQKNLFAIIKLAKKYNL